MGLTYAPTSESASSESTNKAEQHLAKLKGDCDNSANVEVVRVLINTFILADFTTFFQKVHQRRSTSAFPLIFNLLKQHVCAATKGHSLRGHLGSALSLPQGHSFRKPLSVPPPELLQGKS